MTSDAEKILKQAKTTVTIIQKRQREPYSNSRPSHEGSNTTVRPSNMAEQLRQAVPRSNKQRRREFDSDVSMSRRSSPGRSSPGPSISESYDASVNLSQSSEPVVRERQAAKTPLYRAASILIRPNPSSQKSRNNGINASTDSRDERSSSSSSSTSRRQQQVVHGAAAVLEDMPPPATLHLSGNSLTALASRSRTRDRELLMLVHKHNEQVALNEIDYTHTRPAYISTYCFFCEYGDREVDSSPDSGCRPYIRMVNNIGKNYRAKCTISLISELINYYIDNLYIPSIDPATGIAALPWVTIDKLYDHLKSHIINAVVGLADSYRMVIDAIDAQKNDLIDPETGRIDRHSIQSLTKLVDTQLKIIKTSPKDILFTGGSGEQIFLDPKKMGAVANMRRMEPLFRLTDNAIGGAHVANNEADDDPDALHIHDFLNQQGQPLDPDELPM
jgi:hypothetical protein